MLKLPKSYSSKHTSKLGKRNIHTMDIIRLFTLLTLASIIPGQLIRIPLGISGAITLTDVSVIVTVLAFTVHSLYSKRKIYLQKNIFYFFLIFIISALASTILALNTFSINEVTLGTFFLIRFIFYFLISVVALNVIKINEIESWLKAILVFGTIFTLIGLIQLLTFPDLRLLTIFGWDPHSTRLVSSLVDPNFTGGLLALFFTVSLSLYVFKKDAAYLLLSILFLASLILTFSRSAYLALTVATIVIGAFKSPRLIFAILLIFLVSLALISKSRERVVAGLTLDETARARIESWQNAYSIFSKNILFGVGFNTFRYVQIQAGAFSIDNPQGGHSGAGVDSSILFVAATTGIFGLGTFILFLISIFKTIFKGIENSYIKLITFTSIILLLVHSQFVNSLFFPQIMIIFWFLLGLNFVRDL